MKLVWVNRTLRVRWDHWSCFTLKYKNNVRHSVSHLFRGGVQENRSVPSQGAWYSSDQELESNTGIKEGKTGGVDAGGNHPSVILQLLHKYMQIIIIFWILKNFDNNFRLLVVSIKTMSKKYIQGVPHHIRPRTGLNYDFQD